MSATTKRSFTGHLADTAAWAALGVIVAVAFGAGCVAGAVLVIWDDIDRARGVDRRPEVLA